MIEDVNRNSGCSFAGERTLTMVYVCVSDNNNIVVDDDVTAGDTGPRAVGVV